MQTQKIKEDFLFDVDKCYGLYLDSKMGYGQNCGIFAKLMPDLTKEFIIGKGNPNKPEADVMHKVKIGKFIQRNTDGGDNYKNIANLCIVMIYQLWEVRYRAELAEIIGIQKSQLTSDTFGDLRIIRNAIIHNNSNRTSDFAKLKIFTFPISNELNFSGEDIELIINEVKTEIKKLFKI